MVYVDLNPIRAKMANTPETSAHTSIKRRIHDIKRGYQPKTLMPFIGNPKQHQPQGLSFSLIDYIQLVDLSGRCIHPNKRGANDINQSPILQRLGIDETQWERFTTAFEENFSVAAGNVTSLEAYKKQRRRKPLAG